MRVFYLKKGPIAVIDTILNNKKMTQAAWYLLLCKPEKEFFAANALKCILGLETFVPLYQASDAVSTRSAPFFPGYIFVLVDLCMVAVSDIGSCPGVACLVRFGGEPLQVGAVVIDELDERLKAFKAPKSLKPGDIVRMRRGPLQDLAMTFVETVEEGRRVNVLFDFLGGMREVRVDMAELKYVRDDEIKSVPERRQGRSTRGKGRKIRNAGYAVSVR